MWNTGGPQLFDFENLDHYEDFVSKHREFVNFPGEIWCYPIHLAAASPEPELGSEQIKILLKHGAYLEARQQVSQEYGYWTPFLMAAAAGDILQVKTLLDAGADIHATDHIGDNAAILAVKGFRAVMAKMELFEARGCDFDHVNNEGGTALVDAIDSLELFNELSEDGSKTAQERAQFRRNVSEYEAVIDILKRRSRSK